MNRIFVKCSFRHGGLPVQQGENFSSSNLTGWFCDGKFISYLMLISWFTFCGEITCITFVFCFVRNKNARRLTRLRVQVPTYLYPHERRVEISVRPCRRKKPPQPQKVVANLSRCEDFDCYLHYLLKCWEDTALARVPNVSSQQVCVHTTVLSIPGIFL